MKNNFHTISFLSILFLFCLQEIKSQVLWSSSGGSAWLTGTNWTGSAVPTNAQISQFAVNPTAATGVGINFNNTTNAGVQSLGQRIQEVGAVEITNIRAAAFIIGNSSATIGATGSFRVLGTTVNSIANTILRNNSNQSFTFQNIQGSGTQTMTVELGNATNNIVNVDGTGNIVISSSIFGSGKKLSVNINNTGDLRLSGTNTFNGGIDIAATSTGKFRIDAVASLPSIGTIAINTGGRLSFNIGGTYGGITQTLSLNPNQIINPSIDLSTSNLTVIWQGLVSLNTDSRIEVNGAAGSMTLSGNVTGSGNLIKQASGNLILSSSGNNLTGGTQIGNGKLTVNSGSSMGTGFLKMFQTSTNNTAVVLNNSAQTIGTLSSTFTAVTGTQTQIITLNGTILTINQTSDSIFGAGSVSTLSSYITGTGGIVKSGPSKLTLTSSNLYTGNTTISNGNLAIGVSNALSDSSKIILNGGMLSTVGAFSDSFATLTLNSKSTIALGSGSHSLKFAASNSIGWAGDTLFITGWIGTLGQSGTAGKIFVGSSASGLTASQLSKIKFVGFASQASILSNGEIVPSSNIPTIVVSSPSQTTASNISQNSTNNILSNFQAAITIADATLNSISFITVGNYLKTDIASNFILYYDTTNVFGSSTNIGTIIADTAGTYAFTGLTQIINNGKTGYFWIVIDASGTSGSNRTLQILGTVQLTFSSGTPTGSIGAGGIKTFLSPATPVLSAGTLSSFNNQCINGTFGPNNFSLSGTFLTNSNITIDSIPGYIFSTLMAGPYTNSLSIAQSGGTFSQTIYVKFTPISATSYNGNISAGGGGTSSNISISVSGTGTNGAVGLSTINVSTITDTNAYTGGNAITTSCGTISNKGVVWSTSSNPTIPSTASTSNGIDTNSFSSQMTSLLPNTTYYYRAYATNSNGVTSYGNELSFTTLKAEPSNQVTAFSCGTSTTSSIPLTWTAATGSNLPNGYLIKWSNISLNAISNPDDGISQSDSTNTKNIIFGTNNYTFNSLTSGTNYYFKIWTYSNSGSSINYKLNAVPQTTCSTLIAPCLSANFDSSTSVPSGWSGTSTNDILASHLQSAPNCRALASGINLITPVTNNPNSISFYVDASGSGGQIGTLEYSTTGTGGPWTGIGNFTATTAGKTETFPLTSSPNLTSTPNINFRLSSASNTIYIDDLTTYCTPSCTVPSTQATNLSFSNLQVNSGKIQFTRGTGDSLLVLVKSGSAVSGSPISGTNYIANDSFGFGSQIAAGNFVVYKGIDTAFFLKNLVYNTTYHIAVFEYFGNTVCFKTPGLIGSFTTPCDAPTGQATFNTTIVSTNSATLNFTPGVGGTTRLIKLSQTNLFTNPINGTDSTGNTVYSGTSEKIVYNNSGTSISVSGLLASTKYYITIFEANCSGMQKKYNTFNTLDSFITNPVTSNESDCIAIPNSEASKISSIINISGPLSISQGIKVWELLVRDGGIDTTDIDTFPTIINSIKLTQSVGNAIDKWSDAIESVSLFNNSIHIANGVIYSNQIIFSGTPLIRISDDSFANLTIRLTVQISPNDSGTNIDNDDFGFSLSRTNIILGSNSSQMDTGLLSAISANDSNRLDIFATKFRFFTQPSNTGKLAIMNPSVKVEAMDANNNRDLDFTSTIRISSTGSMNANYYIASAISGVASFATIKHNIPENGIRLLAQRNDSLDFNLLSDTFKILNVSQLKAGDLAVIAYDNNTTIGDKIILVNFVDLLPQTKFSLINASYDLKNASNFRSDKWYSSGADNDDIYSHEFTWNGSNSIPRGSIICIDIPSTGLGYTFKINGIDSSNKFIVVNDGGTSKASPNISTSSPDAMFIGQGSWTYYGTHATFDGNILSAFMTGANWKHLSDNVSTITGVDRLSRYPLSQECLRIQGTASSGNYYYYYNGLRTGTRASLLSKLANASNWVGATGNNTDNLASVSPCSNNFTITSPQMDSIFWIGGVDTNWYNCSNWENQIVPDSTTNIIISDTSIYNLDIENIAANASKYGSMAICNHLVIQSNKTFILDDAQDSIKIYGDLVLSSNSYLNLSNGTTGGTIYLRGNWVNNNSSDNISELYSKIVLFDTLLQYFSTNNAAGDILNKLEINKGIKKVFSLSSPLTVNSLLTLNSGIIKTNANILTLGGNISGYETPVANGSYSNNNYVNGKLKRAIGSAGNYFFPVGDVTNGEGYNPTNLEVISGNGYATAEFTPGDPGDCNMPNPILFYCGSTINYMVNYQDMTGEGVWKFTGDSFNYNIQAYPNLLNVNIHPNSNMPPSYTSTYRLLKSPIGTSDWTPYVLLGDSCSVSNNYYALEGKNYRGFSQFAPGGGSGFGTALPVELLYFKGSLDSDNNAYVEWATASERNNHHFEILKSDDGIHFENISTVLAIGNSQSVNKYSQKLSLTKSSYLKLKQVDNDDTNTESKTIYLKMKTLTKTNVLNDGNTLKILSEDVSELRLSNLAGATIIQTNRTELNISNLPSNIYILTILQKNRDQENIKIIK